MIFEPNLICRWNWRRHSRSL